MRNINFICRTLMSVAILSGCATVPIEAVATPRCPPILPEFNGVDLWTPVLGKELIILRPANASTSFIIENDTVTITSTDAASNTITDGIFELKDGIPIRFTVSEVGKLSIVSCEGKEYKFMNPVTEVGPNTSTMPESRTSHN